MRRIVSILIGPFSYIAIFGVTALTETVDFIYLLSPELSLNYILSIRTLRIVLEGAHEVLYSHCRRAF